MTILEKDLGFENTSSLPSLMNECLRQSYEMQELLKIKALQSRLFAAISTFASLKYLGKFQVANNICFNIICTFQIILMNLIYVVFYIRNTHKCSYAHLPPPFKSSNFINCYVTSMVSIYGFFHLVIDFFLSQF